MRRQNVIILITFCTVDKYVLRKVDIFLKLSVGVKVHEACDLIMVKWCIGVTSVIDLWVELRMLKVD